MGTQENGKYKYANMRVVLELMHTTIGCGFIGNPNMLISIPNFLCAALCSGQ